VYSRRGCFVDPFTPQLDGVDLSPGLIEGLDPVFHLALDAGRQAWEAARTTPLDRRRVGVILGNIALPTEHASALARAWLGRTFEERAFGHATPAPFSVPPLYGTSLPAAVLARALGLGGGSCTLDAACASSLYAIKLAADELRAGRADAMLAGGVSRPDCLYTQMGFSQLRALSPTGTCRPFDAAADGLVVGEGAGVVLLKRLDDALRHGDRILAVLAGSGLSNDVAGGLLAPASEGQLRAMRDAYGEAGWEPADVDLVECHATGTPVGDRTEFESLRGLWGPRTGRAGRCVIGSVKSTVGHLLTAAGAAAVIKVLQALDAGVLPPTANFCTPAPGLRWEEAPFDVLTEGRPWVRRGPGVPRRAAVSGFGFGGVNAHLLLEEWQGDAAKVAWAQVPERPRSEAVAVVGMEACFGPWTSLAAFQERVLGGGSTQPQPPTHWWGVPGSQWFRGKGLAERCFAGWYLAGRLSVAVDRFRVPPRELAEMLPQQLLLLQVAAGALSRARVLDGYRPRTGAYVGLGIDLNTTNCHFRWSVLARAAEEARRRRLGPDEAGRWASAVADAAAPPLTADRTMGALGSVAASRLAREFRLGGPCFTVNAEEASGLRGLELAIGALQRGEIDEALVAAVDLAGDVRATLAAHSRRPFSASGTPRPFDTAADGPVPGEGAAVVVLKRLADALADGDRVYAVIRGVGVAGGAADADEVYRLAMQRAYDKAGVDPASVEYLEGHGSCHPEEDAAEARAVVAFYGPRDAAIPLQLASAKGDVGHAGAAAGLASFVKACLSLRRQVLPPLRNLGRPRDELLAAADRIRVSPVPRVWLRDPSAGPRRAAVSACGGGSCVHVVLEDAQPLGGKSPELTDAAPLTTAPPGVRAVEVAIGGGPFVIQPPPSPRPALAARGMEVSASGPVPAEVASAGSGSQVGEAVATREAVACAHEAYLRLSRSLVDQVQRTVSFQTTLLEAAVRGGVALDAAGARSVPGSPGLTPRSPGMSAGASLRSAPTTLSVTGPPTTDGDSIPRHDEAHGQGEPRAAGQVFLDRDGCLEFARGSIGRVLGPAYATIDAHPTRVRLPDEPLLLVDRIMSIEGEPLSLTSGRIVTEHDVRPDTWYLDGGRAPACISIEAGQADLFLSAYLGVDLRTRGRAVYRLLDAAVTFHRSLPRPGDVLRYDIRIDHFFRQGDTHLFRFGFEGTANGEPLLTMTDGCAGFFSADELAAGRGVVRTALARRERPGTPAPGERDLAPMGTEAYTEAELDALRAGELGAAFGPAFAGLTLAPGLRLPDGRMRVVHRVSELDPAGGRFGIGLVRSEADVHPGDWFLTCHFVDDQVMPGTLMYECCLHTLRIFLLRLGWVATEGDAACEPVPGVTSRLRCRGQVTGATRTVRCEVVLKERGYRPEPYAIADALMYSDGRPIVEITDMCVRLVGLTREGVTALWARQRAQAPLFPQGRGAGREGNDSASVSPSPPTPLAQGERGEGECLAPGPDPRAREPRTEPFFSKERLLAFAVGKPSAAFGEPYRVFDDQRFIARLPGPPYQFIDRVVRVEAEPWRMVPGGVAWAEYDVHPDAWYFAADRQPVMPFAVLLEVALQSCGWLAAYCGSALTSPEDLCFRNLGGQAVVHSAVGPDAGTLAARVRLTDVASSGGMILQHFDFEVRGRQGPIYSGRTSFGFFTRAALAQQVGVREAKLYEPTADERARGRAFPFPTEPPLPDRMLRMLDRVDLLVGDGGPAELGFIQGGKDVDPAEWFFRAHFLQDPVWPGSLGLEAFLQLLKVAMVDRWALGPASRFRVRPGRGHRWRYRGQVVPTTGRVTVQAFVSAAGARELTADGWLAADGRVLYEMRDFTLEAE
jgi:acyl transferase domain-containing protein/3-hydroxymyristoyl/3-hydroxydecanoyl-(acyl carrier protein) dehydratase